MRLQDKVVAITGSGSGLGRAAAIRFAKEGAKVVVSDVVDGRAQAVAKAIEADGGQATALNVDVRKEGDVTQLIDTAVSAFGRIDIAWANAGVPEPGFGAQAFEDSKLEDWNNILAVNTTGIYLVFREAAKRMIPQGGGTLLATTSAASFVAYPGFPMYVASKAAGNGLIRATSLELGKHGIRVNGLAPFHGMSVNFALPPDADVLGLSYEEMQPWDPDQRAMPLRVGRPPRIDDNVNIALFLASDESAYMSGQTIAATDGGTQARVAIIFPTDLGGDNLTEGVLPPEVQAQMGDQGA
jgi:NAD(P)-dependent dehydrogenase (short-subunit alcohol dehydrogenase family)